MERTHSALLPFQGIKQIQAVYHMGFEFIIYNIIRPIRYVYIMILGGVSFTYLLVFMVAA